MDLLRDRMVRAERTCNEEAALIERLRSDLSLSRSHAKNLEKTLNEVTSSTFWKLTWPMRYVVSKSRQIWHTFPLFVLLGELRRDGISGVREHARARRQKAGVAAVMVNGMPEIRALAHLVSKADCDHDGVAEILETLGI
mgnify:CR=1 FL=1